MSRERRSLFGTLKQPGILNLRMSPLWLSPPVLFLSALRNTCCANRKPTLADEVKVLRSTGYRELDASAVMTLFKWKFQPGTVDHCLAIDSLGEMIGYLFGSGQTMGTLTEMEFHRRRFMNRHDKRALL